MRKNILALVVCVTVLLLSNTVVLAENICLDNQTLQRNVSVKIGNRPAEPIATFERCEFGCDIQRNVCNDAPYIYILIIMAIVVVAFISFKYVIIPMVSK